MLLVRCIVLSLTWLARDHCTAAPVHHQHGDDTGHVADQVQGAALLPPVALSEGAQGNFDLFFPTLNVKEETSTTVPVIHLPAENTDDLEKVAADAILDMFPTDLLENNKKVRPVDVKIIEHDGYIDYEIEFVEIEDYYDYYSNEEVIDEKEVTTEISESTFVDLLKKARSKHRQNINQNLIKDNHNGTPSERTDNKRRKPVARKDDKIEGAINLSDETPSVFGRSTTLEPDTTTANVVDDDVVKSAGGVITTETQMTFDNQFSESPRSAPLVREPNNKARRTEEQKKESVGQQSEIFQQFSDDFVSSESKSNLRVFTGPPVDTTTTKKVEDFLPEEVEEATTDNYDYEYYDHDNTKLHSERVPKLISNNKGSDVQIIPDSQEKTLKPGGDYHEVNPGQYYEVNPGQYHEINPGQYHEVNPGQYHEVNPGQYHEVNPGQYRVDDKDIKVSVDDSSDDDSRTYDVRANAGDFIIGEVGRIDINSGQTLEGVRYTALESEVDYDKIKEILEMYFGTRTK